MRLIKRGELVWPIYLLFRPFTFLAVFICWKAIAWTSPILWGLDPVALVDRHPWGLITFSFKVFGLLCLDLWLFIIITGKFWPAPQYEVDNRVLTFKTEDEIIRSFIILPYLNARHKRAFRRGRKIRPKKLLYSVTAITDPPTPREDFSECFLGGLVVPNNN